MGKRHRKLRSISKRLLLESGLRETELGELKLTKAALRRRRLLGTVTRMQAEIDIVRVAHERVVEDLKAIEDAVFIQWATQVSQLSL